MVKQQLSRFAARFPKPREFLRQSVFRRSTMNAGRSRKRARLCSPTRSASPSPIDNPEKRQRHAPPSIRSAPDYAEVDERSTETRTCDFFSKLPLELRQQIYYYALDDVTITVARHDFDPSERRSPSHHIEGIPPEYVPFVRNEHNVEALRIGKFPTARSVTPQNSHDGMVRIASDKSLAGMSMDSGYGSAGSSMYSDLSTQRSPVDPSLAQSVEPTAHIPALTNLALLQTCHQMRSELQQFMRTRACPLTTLHVNYPYGILVLQQHYPAMLRYAKRVVISGQFHVSDDPDCDLDLSNVCQLTQANATTSLGFMLSTIYPHVLEVAPAGWDFELLKHSFEMRIFFPGECNYMHIWSAAESPVAKALSYVSTGEVSQKVWRGTRGNGVVFECLPILSLSQVGDGETVEPRLEEYFHELAREPVLNTQLPKHESSRGFSSDAPTSTRWPRGAITTVWRRFTGRKAVPPPGSRSQPRRQPNMSEEFWGHFGDRLDFEEQVPEKHCWVKA